MIALQPRVGKMTFETEGTEQGRFHSRVLVVPSPDSGLTLGRGYDMRRKTSSKILHDMSRIGVSKELSKLISNAAGLYGASAEKFLKANSAPDDGTSKAKASLLGFEISQEQQVRLFEISYQEEEAETKRLCTKPDVTARYGRCDWELLDSGIKEVLVDLKFRGDYVNFGKQFIQKSVVDNDLEEFTKLMSDTDKWRSFGVPPDRIRRRIDFLKSNVVCKRP